MSCRILSKVTPVLARPTPKTLHIMAPSVVAVASVPTLSELYRRGTLQPITESADSASSSVSHIRATPRNSLNLRISLYTGTITALQTDAIVNAANRSLLGGGGVDGAIHRAAGPELKRACQRLDGCPTGHVKITHAYRLPCQRVIHAVGPVYDVLQVDRSRELLESCYRESLRCAVDHGCRTVAFSAISTGVYGYPSLDAAHVAVETVRRFLESPNGAKLDRVVFVTFEAKDTHAYHTVLPQWFPQDTATLLSPDE